MKSLNWRTWTFYYGMSDFVRITVLPACTAKGLTSGTSFENEQTL